MKLLEKIKSLTIPLNSSPDHGIAYFREKLLFYLLLSSLILGLIAYLPSIYFAYKFQLYSIIFIDTAAFFIIGFLFLNKKLSFHWKAAGLLTIFYLLGVWLLIEVGPMGAGFLWLFMASVMTGVLLGTKPVLFSLGLNTLFYCLLSIFVYLRKFSWMSTFPHPASLWIILGANFICINALVSISVAILLDKLDEIFTREKSNSSKLKVEIQNRIQMEKENEQLVDQLLHSQKMEAMGTLAGGVAHDFNNILSAIMGYAELSLLDRKEKDELYENLENICMASERAKSIIHQILTFSRQTRAQKEHCSLKTILKECSNFFKIGVPSTIEFSCRFYTEDDRIFADQAQIHQVIMNLCTNAMHAIGNQNGKIIVTLNKEIITPENDLSKILDPDNYLVLRIEDTGHGIEKNKISKVFEPYFTTKKTGKGTGMGLAIAHGIIKDHNGEILVSSTPGKGSEFSVYLPISAASDPSLSLDKTISAKGNETILYVDDEKNLLDINKRYLERLGYCVEVEYNPMDAFQTFKEAPDRFHLVVTDKKMPRMTGDILKNKIKEIKPDMPVVLCSGFADSDVDQGFDEILVKPVKCHLLAQTIRSVLDRQLQ